jgi:Flp pilus assembly protein TadB
MWNLIGAAAALLTAALAWKRSRAPGGFYAEGVYGMGPSLHRRYAAVSLAFALVFGIAFALHATFAGLVVLAAYAVIAILYYSSFVRGASDYHE